MKKPAITAIALLSFIGTARAIDAPTYKEGFWAVHMVTTDNPGNKITDGKYSLCRNHAFDQHLDNTPKNPRCTSKTDALLGNKHVVETSCHFGTTTIDSRTVGTHINDTTVHSESTSTYTPALMGHTQETMVIDFKYLGACPAGIQPGDRVNSDGTVMHLWKH
jgi:hypothetical protein